MAISPERNDVDISKLFNWGNKFEIFDRYGNKIVDAYLRLIGDAETNRARVFAIRKSAELRKKLRTEDSDERVAFIESVLSLEDREELLDMLVSLNIRKYSYEAAKEVRIPFPKEPKSEAPLEEFEKFQLELDGYEEKRNQEISRVTTEKLLDYRSSLDGVSTDGLKKSYERMMIDMLCEQKMITVFRESSTFYGTFQDAEYKVPMFSSFDEFDNLPTEIKEQYVDAYSSLEINIEELKKSLEAMQ